MNTSLEKDLLNIDSILDTIKKYGLDYLANINNAQTGQHPVAVNQNQLPEQGQGTLAALNLFKNEFKKLIVASGGPRYWGFVTGGATPAAIAGDWLTAVFDQNTQSITGNGDLSAIVELETIRMMLELFELPDSFNGGFVSGATMSNFTCLGVARQWAGKQIGRDIAREGMDGNIIVLSAVPHSSALKSLSMLGIGSSNIVSVNTINDREAIDINDLREKLELYKNKPVIVSCSGGTVNSVDFDDFAAIADLKKQYNFWMHIDAAFGGFAACSSSYKNLLKGWEHADSITVDCHKWMNVPYDSAVLFVKKTHNQLQVETFQNSNAPYLGDPEENFSYLNFLPENSRRFRALPAWFNLIAYGREGLKSIVDNNIDNALEFGKWVENSEEFELVAPVLLNTVCFRLKENEIPAASFLKELNSRGKVFMTPSVLKGQACIRAAFVNWRTTSHDLEIAKLELVTVFQQLSTKV